MHSQQRGPPFLCHQHPAAAKGLGWRVGEGGVEVWEGEEWGWGWGGGERENGRRRRN